MSVVAPRSVVLHYWEDTAAAWSARLLELKSQGVDEVHTFVPWALHESVQGIRDFAKASRLRLEKFLSLSHQAGITVRVTLGFPARRESIPPWAFTLGESSTLVPAILWRSGNGDLGLTRLPSLHDEAFFAPFLEYASDAFALLSLYRFPEGPVVGVNVDWGVYRQDQAVTAAPQYVSFLQQRYPQTGLLNLRYHCTFRDFGSAASTQGTRVLFDKRPWLAAYDFKYCREKMLEERAQGILALRTVEPLLDLISFGEPEVSVAAQESSWAVGMDPVLLEGEVGVRAYPFSPLGLINSQASGTFRLWEFLFDRARVNRTPFFGLGSVDKAPAASVHVIAGKFLSSRHVNTLRAWAEDGVRLFFPFGMPQYDENLSTIEWKPGVSRLPLQPGAKHTRVAVGRGELCFPEAPIVPQSLFWEQLHDVSCKLSEGASA